MISNDKILYDIYIYTVINIYITIYICIIYTYVYIYNTHIFNELFDHVHGLGERQTASRGQRYFCFARLWQDIAGWSFSCMDAAYRYLDAIGLVMFFMTSQFPVLTICLHFSEGSS